MSTKPKKEIKKIKNKGKNDNMPALWHDVTRMYLDGPIDVRSHQTRAYMAVKYNEPRRQPSNSEHVMVHRIFTAPRVQAKIREYLTRQTSPDAILARLAAESEANDAKPADRIRAVELLGKTHAMFVDRQDTTVDMTVLFSDSPDAEDEDSLNNGST